MKASEESGSICYLFTGSIYYPYGGAGDFKGTFLCIEKAKLEGMEYEWWQITNEDLHIIKSGNYKEEYK